MMPQLHPHHDTFVQRTDDVSDGWPHCGVVVSNPEVRVRVIDAESLRHNKGVTDKQAHRCLHIKTTVPLVTRRRTCWGNATSA
jgi:hypothetical protein